MKYRNNLLSLLIFLLAFFEIASAQNTVAGMVKDSTDNPIEYANVVLTDLNSGTLKAGTITDKDGLFKIELTEDCECVIKVSFIGFKTWSKNLQISASQSLGEIELSRVSNKLDEVILTSKTEIFTRNEDKIVFNVQNSPLKSGFTGVEVLGQSPSVWVDENDNISIRNESARVLINGRRINLTGEALASYLSDIESKNIKSVEVQTNKDASKDAESTGGIINIILIRKPLGYNGSIGSFYNFKEKGYYTNFNRLSFNYGAEKWNMYASYSFFKNTSVTNLKTSISYLETGNFLDDDGSSEFITDRNSYRFGFVTLLSKNHEFGVELNGYDINRELENSSNLSLINNSDILETGTVSSFDNNDLDLLSGVLNYTWKMRNKGKLNVYMDYLKQKTTNFNNHLSEYDLGLMLGVDERNNSDSRSETLSFQSDFNTTFENKIKLGLGVKYSVTNRENKFLAEFLESDIYLVNDDRTTSFNYKEGIAAGYFSISKKFRDKNYYKVGLRVENTDLNRRDLIDNSLITQNYTNFFPSLFYSREFNKNKSASISYSRSLRRPSFRLLNNDVIKLNDFRFLLGNPDLQPEYVNKYEVNYLFNRNSLSLYYSNTNDAINGVYFLEDDITFYKKLNSGMQVQYGLEYNKLFKMNKSWSLRFFGNLYNRKFVTDEGIDKFEKVTVSMRLFNTFKINNTTNIQLSGFYTSPRTDAFYEAFEFYRINLGFRKSFFKRKLTLRVDINDVFNSLEYRNVREFDNFINTAFTKPITRTFRFWLTYNFSNKVKISKKKNKSKNDAAKRLENGN